MSPLDLRRALVVLALALATALASCGGSSGSFGTGGGTCSPGVQIACACPGGGNGVQICAQDGSAYGLCAGCPSGSTGSGQGGAGQGGHAAGSSSSHPASSGAGGHGATTGAGGASTTGVTGTGATTSTGGAGGGAHTPLIYAHDATALFTLDPTQPAQPVVSLGAFDCIGGAGQDTSMLDLAVSSKGDLWGVSAKNVYLLLQQGAGVHCASTVPLVIAAGTSLFGLSFAPKGVLDPGKDVLVGGDTAGNLWAVDTTTGVATLHGTLGLVPADDGHGHAYANAGKAWELSGDLVFMAGAGAPLGFATVRDCPSPPSTASCSVTDTLVQLDLGKLATATTGAVLLTVRGQVVRSAGCNDAATSYGRLYGIAAYQDLIYGFSHSGAIVGISNVDGTGCLVQNVAADLWAGAGIVPKAPVVAP